MKSQRTRSAVSGAVGTSTPMPRKVNVMKATLVDKPFSRAGWLFENKWDGVRAVAIIKDGKLRLVSRNHKEMTISYPELADLPLRINAKTAILDGEIVMLGMGGVANFQLLQSRFGLTNQAKLSRETEKQKVVYEVFDLLYLNGRDLTRVPLLDRKAALKKILKPSPNFKYTTHVRRKGEAFFKKVKRSRGEGMIAKEIHSLYEHHRSTAWLKVKTSMRQEVVIAGYTKPQGARDYFGALELGIYDRGAFRSIGRVGTGFSQASLRTLYQKMQTLKSPRQPFDEPFDADFDIQWIKPKLVCEVEFSQWTKDLKLRHPSFEGLRSDKDPKDCTLERKSKTAQVVRQVRER